jgi:prolyl-tRNA editing enzyme YbaK/EbsC (Cys-tRNA(Pro) deacylase)
MDKTTILETINSLASKKIGGMYLNDFLLTWDKTADEIAAVFLTAEILRSMRRNNISCRVFDSGLAVAIFRDKSTQEPVLVIASGVNRVDLKKIKKATGIKLGKADGNFVKEKVGFAIGGIPPAGHHTPLKTLLDPDLKQYNEIWAAAGTPFAVFQLKPADLEPLTNGTWVDLSME